MLAKQKSSFCAIYFMPVPLYIVKIGWLVKVTPQDYILLIVTLNRTVAFCQ